jgi:hypothetical protein
LGRKVAVIAFAVFTVAFAYFVFPESVISHPERSVSGRDLLFALSSIATLIGGGIVSVVAWRG